MVTVYIDSVQNIIANNKLRFLRYDTYGKNILIKSKNSIF